MNRSPLKAFNYDFIPGSPTLERPPGPQIPCHPDANWVGVQKPPLFWEPLSGHPVEVKLANMTAALLAGADPNEMDHEPDNRRSYGRPLHCVVHSNGPSNFLKDNIPLIELLIEYGADPRLPGPKVLPVYSGLGSPLNHAKLLATFPNHGFEELFECGFYQEAYRIMKQAADNLDARDAAKRRWEYLEWLLGFMKFW